MNIDDIDENLSDIDLEDYDIGQFCMVVREDGGRERHMRDVAKMINAPVYTINDMRGEDINVN